MRVLRYTDSGFANSLASFQRTFNAPPELERTVREILMAVRDKGDAALLDLTRKFGGPALRPKDLRVHDKPRKIDGATRRAIVAAHANVYAFARRSLRKTWSGRNAQGALVGERYDPFARVGIYVPGGTAPLASTAIMTITLAAAAGVPEIAVATPPDATGGLNDALLYALRHAGATEIYRIGGAQAIGALAFGTETIKPVLKIFGPGNAYVVEAKRQVFGRVAIDLLPGPSEILVLADASADPAWVAADLLAQAEHGKGSQILFVTNSVKLLAKVEREIAAQLRTLRRREHLAEVLEHGATLVLVKTLHMAVDIANAFAPEHISLVTRQDAMIASQIRHSGAIFVGGYSPVAAGDFVAGPSHTLPTGGAGKSFAGLSVDMFQRRTSTVQFDAKSLRKSVAMISQFSAMEGLDAHGRSATIRFA